MKKDESYWGAPAVALATWLLGSLSGHCFCHPENSGQGLPFPTKYQDDETDLVYYGYRFYNSSTGRWISRDPAEEKGGTSLYCFASNDGINRLDLLGLLVGSVQVVGFRPVFYDGPGFFNSDRGWYADFRWTPPKGGDWDKACDCKPCQLAVWIQSIQKNGGSWSAEWGDNPNGDDGYMKYTLPWNCNAVSGDRTSPIYAEMWDQPGIFHASDLSLILYSPMAMNFVSSVKCLSGKDAGTIYATVTWGYTWKYNAKPVGLGPTIQ